MTAFGTRFASANEANEHIATLEAALSATVEQRDRLLDTLKLCDGNISSLLAADHPRVYSDWLQAVRDSIASIDSQ